MKEGRGPRRRVAPAAEERELSRVLEELPAVRLRPAPEERPEDLGPVAQPADAALVQVAPDVVPPAQRLRVDLPVEVQDAVAEVAEGPRLQRRHPRPGGDAGLDHGDLA